MPSTRVAALFLALALLAFALLSPAPAMGVEVPDLAAFAPLHGRYAPAGDCSHQPQVVVDATGMTFENGPARHRVERIDHAERHGGAGYTGASTWLLPLYGRERPILMEFHAGGEADALHIDPYDRGWLGGPPLTGRHQVLVDASPYARCG